MTTQQNNQVNDRTINNNFNNIITTNNNSYCLPSSFEEQTLPVSLRSEVAPSSATQDFSRDAIAPAPGKPLLSSVGNPAGLKNQIVDATIPDDWDYVKLDLFDTTNAKDLAKGKTRLKITLNVKKKGQPFKAFNALLNSPIRNMKRGLDADTWDGDHYTMVRNNYQELREIFSDVRASKFYEKGYKKKGVSIEYLSVLVAQHPDEGHYIVNLFFGDYQWVWMLKGGAGHLTPAQRKSGIIATVGVRKGNKVKNIDARSIL